MAEISGAIGAVSINLNDLDQHQQMGAGPEIFICTLSREI